MKKRNKIIIIVLSVLAFILIGGIFGFNMFIGTDKFKNMLTGIMEKQINAKVNIDQWDASLFTGFHFTNLSIDQPEGYGAGKLFETSRFTMQFNIWDLLKSKITLSEIIIEDLNAYLNQDSEGLWFFQTMTSKDKKDDDTEKREKHEKKQETDETPSDMLLLAERIKIKNANFLAKDRNGNIIGELKDANISGKINMQGNKINVILDMDMLSVQLSKKITGLSEEVSAKNIAVKLNVDEDKAQIENMSLELFGGSISTKLTALNYMGDQPEIDMEINVNNLNAKPVLAIAGQPADMISTPITCSLSTKLKVKSIDYFKKVMDDLNKQLILFETDHNTLPGLCSLLDNINNLETNLKLGKMHLKGIGPIGELVINESNLPVSIKNRSISLNGISAEIWGGKFLASLNLILDHESLGLKVNLETKGINTAPLLEIVKQDKDMISGTLNAKIAIECAIKDPFPFSPTTIDTSNIKGNIEIGEINSKVAGRTDNVNITFNVSEGKVSVTPLSIKTFGGEINVTLEADKLQSSEPVFNLNLAVRDIDAATLLKSTGQDTSLASGKLNVTLTAKGKGNSLGNLSVDSLIGIGPIKAMGNIEIAKVTLPVNFKEGIVTIQPVVKAFNGELKAALNADITKSPPTFDMKTSISEMDAVSLLKVCGLEDKIVSGPLNVNLTAKGKGDSLSNLDTKATINIPVIYVDMAGTQIKNTNGRIHFINQKALIEEFNAEVYDGSISMTGSYDLQKESFEADVNLESLGLDKALEGFMKDIQQVKHFLDTTKVMTGSAGGNAKVAADINNFDLMKGTFDLKIKDGIIDGHPIQLKLAEVLNKPELENITFSHIDTKGAVDGLLINLDNFDLMSKMIAVTASNATVDINKDELELPIELGLSPDLAEKLDKPVEEIKYGLTKNDNGFLYLPPFKITGSVSKPDIKKAMVEVILKAAAKGYAKKEVFKLLGKDIDEETDKKETDKKETKKEETDNSKTEKSDVMDVIGNVFDGLFGGKKKKKKDKEEK